MRAPLYFIATALIAAVVLNSCGAQPNQTERKPWTEEEHSEFAHNCFTSTRFSLSQMKIAATEAQIKEVCDCTARSIEAEYNFDAAKRIPKKKVESILSEALQKCAPELMNPSTTDTLQ
jgi:molecular chaperone GrpE (heat shock protein)